MLIEQELPLVMISVQFVSSSSHVPRFNKTAAESLVTLSTFQELDGTKIQTITTMSDSFLVVVWIEPTSNGKLKDISLAAKKPRHLTLIKFNKTYDE